jgi:protease-4
MYSLIRIFIFLLIVLNLATSQITNFSVPLANSDNIFALYANPAGLGTGRGMQMLVSRGYNSNEFIDDFSFNVNLGHLGFMYQNDVYFRRYTLGMGFKLNKWTKAGFSYGWNTIGYLKDGLSLGLLVRPIKFISLGFTGNFINNPKHRNPDYVTGLSIRPFNNRFTLSMDYILKENKLHSYLKKTRWRINIDIEPFNGIFLKGHYNKDYAGIGLGLALNHMRLGGYNFVDQDQRFERGKAYIHLSSQYFRTIIGKKKPKYVKIKISGPIIEENRRQGIFARKQLTIYNFGQMLKEMKMDDSVEGVLLYIDGLRAGMAKIEELSALLDEFRSSGKKVYIYAEYLSNLEFYLATSSDQIILNPAGYLELTGFQFSAIFLKRLLDKLGIVAELESIKEYKTAADMLTLDSISVYHREVINSFADQFFNQLITQISKKRNLDRQKVKEIIDHGPYSAEKASDLGLIDRVMYQDELKNFIEEENRCKYVTYNLYRKMKPYDYDWDIAPATRMAIIYATGTITRGENKDDMFIGNTMGCESIAEAIRTARENPAVKVIILRIDSGGGLALASEIIWREVELTTSGKNKKPVIVSMSDVAASGGYFIACAADEIYADPLTTTGSIGVIAGKMNVKELFVKIGINIEHIKRGEHAGIFSSSRGFTPGEKEKIVEETKEIYKRFISKVAQGRSMTTEQVNEIGRGRIWTGDDALKNGLIDGIAGLYDVIKLAEKKAGIKEGAPYSIMILPKYRWYWPFAGRDMDDNAKIFHRLPQELQDLLKYGYRFSCFEDDPYLYIMPYELLVE